MQRSQTKIFPWTVTLCIATFQKSLRYGVDS